MKRKKERLSELDTNSVYMTSVLISQISQWVEEVCIYGCMTQTIYSLSVFHFLNVFPLTVFSSEISVMISVMS